MRLPKKNKKKFLSVPRLLAWSFAVVALIETISAVGAFSSPEFAYAQDGSYAIPLAVPIGNYAQAKFDQTTRPIAEYVQAVYTYAIGAVGILAAVMLMIGGLRWILAGGNASSISEAREMIFASLSGLVLVMTSYLILSQVNPALVKLGENIVSMKPITKTAAEGNLIGCKWVEYPVNTLSFGCVPSSPKQCTDKKDGDLKRPECCCEYNPVSDDCSWSKGRCSTGYEQMDDGYTEYAVKSCGSKPAEGTLSDYGYCCCKILEWNDWKFDPGVSNQLGQTDPSLRDLLGCMRKQLSSGQGRISSISDKAVVYPETMNRCTISYTKPPCDHAKGSCHYSCGGTSGNFSCAVDFGDQENGEYIKEAAGYCGAGFVLDEGDHIHISTEKCPHN